MWVERMVIKNIRSFAEGDITFSPGVNVIIGPNNAGKSTILLPLLSLQDGLPNLTIKDRRMGEERGNVLLALNDCKTESFGTGTSANVAFELTENSVKISPNNSPNSFKKLPSSEPENRIYPFLSRRKKCDLADTVGRNAENTVSENFQNLNAKIDRLSNPAFQPAHDMYMKACEDILDFHITTAASDRQGKVAVYTIRNTDNIPLSAMGEGVTNILGLVTNLVMAKGHIFLIEELENDIHPAALKSLLNLIAYASKENQFIITTHSHIVLRELGALEGSKIFKVDCELIERMPTATVEEVDNTPQERRSILQELGYELCDMDIASGWLILEESSAETIIREYLIPWFADKLKGRLNTCSAAGVSKVRKRLDSLSSLFLFVHLEPIYKNYAWVLVDAGEDEEEFINELISTYTKSGWDENQFLQLNHHYFEDYYPGQFQEQVVQMKLMNKKDQQTAKKSLLAEVEKWIKSDEETAKKEFASSAGEVIGILKEIESSLKVVEDSE